MGKWQQTSYWFTELVCIVSSSALSMMCNLAKCAFLPPNAKLLPSSILTERRCFQPKRAPLSQSSPATRVTMLRVQKKRRPDHWDKNMSSLSGRFLPLDPRDEAILDVLENSSRSPFIESYDMDRRPSDVCDGIIAPSTSRKWSKRSEAARKRWSDPVYRAKMLEKRAEKRRRDAEESDELDESSKKLEIGCMDSITLSDESKAQAINAYARSNKLRSEKITAFHKNRKVWMEERLQDSPQNLSEKEYVQKKIDQREKRRQSAIKRNKLIKAKKDAEDVDEQ